MVSGIISTSLNSVKFLLIESLDRIILGDSGYILVSETANTLESDS